MLQKIHPRDHNLPIPFPSIASAVNQRLPRLCQDLLLHLFEYCEEEQVLGFDGGCYDICDEYYCESTIPQIDSQECSDSNYLPGSDSYCHAACTENSYCSQGSICYKNQCLSCSFGTYLYEDGTCRKW